MAERTGWIVDVYPVIVVCSDPPKSTNCGAHRSLRRRFISSAFGRNVRRPARGVRALPPTEAQGPNGPDAGEGLERRSSGRFPRVAPVAVANLSEEATAIVKRERATVAARVADLRRQSEAFHRLVDEIDADLSKQDRTLRRMDEMLGLAPQLPLDLQHEELRGQRLREIAVEVLRQRVGPTAEIHYLDWLRLLEAEGLCIGGKDRTATFLTQIRKAPQIEAVRPRSGLYRLKAA